ncbi:Gfo/Idh/MocA family oxidoreductase [Paenibacillus albicereus]|uniref:Gfo/Idh/MocA family oxidoreductase n=1 Tax=Paenibacillus albicereus TaxID=2726185 RepID=A0A6H2GUV4_9BACL|nr:Gfo/Idh/MocA family oxidoreductase [Paenibacillus albicereus]QJC51172.1 Gfo/Idh/MocA family oxidoreductase [Paenibacillus albicereus]
MRIGILGPAAIAERAVLQPARGLDGIEVAAIAGRDPARVDDYADRYGIPVRLRDFRELLALPELDAVYIPLSNELHHPWTMEALRAGRHVLVEKPAALGAAQLAEMHELAAARGLQLEEALMARHHPWQDAAAELAESGRLGRLLGIASEIAQPFRALEGAGSYRSDPRRGGGAFRDFGCYWLQLVQRLAGTLEAEALSARSAFDGPGGCDWTFEASVRCGGIDAELSASFERPACSRHTLRFERGEAVVRDFFRCAMGAYRLHLDVRQEDGSSERISFEPQSYYVHQLLAFRDRVEGRAPAPDARLELERAALAERLLEAAAQRRRPTRTKEEKRMTSTEQRVIEMVSEVKQEPELARSMGAETSLIEDVVLDSLQMIHFVLAVEDAFGVEIDFETFDFDHMQSVRTLAGFLDASRSSISAG